MGLANEKAHVVLNGKSYILIEESYEKRAQQPFTARFATGDPTEGDNSFWQFLSQKGWVSEGQEIFQTTTNFRQSCGWDMRNGRPRIGYGIESLPLLNPIASPYSLIAAHTLDDMASGTMNWTLWNDGGPSGNGGLIAAQAGAFGCRSGYSSAESDTLPHYAHLGGSSFTYYQGNNQGAGAILGGTPSPLVDPGAVTSIPARGTTLAVAERIWYENLGSVAAWSGSAGDTPIAFNPTYHVHRIVEQIYQVGMTGLLLAASGDYSFDVFIRNSVNIIQCAVGFMLSTAGGGYVLEISGAGGTTAKLFKTTKANAWDNTADTLLKTWTTSSVIGSKTTFKVSIAAGVFSLYQDGVLVGGGTATDSSYTTGDCIRFTTSYCSTGDITVSNFVIPASAASASSATGKFIHYNNQLILAYNANGVSPFIFTDLIGRSQASNIPQITHLNCRDAVVWYRDADPSGGLNSVTAKSGFLCAVAGTTLNVYSGTTIAYTVSTNSNGGLVIPINSTTLLVIGLSAENSGLICIDRFIFTANTWTLASTKTIHLDGGVAGQVVNSYAFDENGTIHFASNDLSGTIGGMPSRVYEITSTDVLATNPTISNVTTIPDFIVRGIAGLANTTNNSKPLAIYLLGAYLEGNYAYASVLRYPGTTVYRSTKGHPISGGTAGELFNLGVATYAATSKSIRFLSATDADSWDPVIELDVDQFVREVASFHSGQMDTLNPNTVAITEWNGRFYCLNAQAGTIRRTLPTRGGLGTDFDASNPLGSIILRLSDMGRNTSLISKSLFSVVIEVSEPLVASHNLTITVNGVTVGNVTAADTAADTSGICRKEIILSSELTASIFTPRIIAGQDNPWNGYVKFLMLKYVPTQFKKRAWGFGIRATRHLKMLDGSRESRTPAQIFADIEAAWASNTPMTFIDVDGVSYNVIVTDFKQKRPLIATTKQADNEAFYFVELLQI